MAQSNFIVQDLIKVLDSLAETTSYLLVVLNTGQEEILMQNESFWSTPKSMHCNIKLFYWRQNLSDANISYYDNVLSTLHIWSVLFDIMALNIIAKGQMHQIHKKIDYILWPLCIVSVWFWLILVVVMRLPRALTAKYRPLKCLGSVLEFHSIKFVGTLHSGKRW